MDPNKVPHALIIEDEMIVAMELEGLLSELGFGTCDIADSLDEAMGCAVARRPDLITVDLQIIGGSGKDAIAAIIARMGAIPHVFVTANAETLTGITAAPIVDKPIETRRFNTACRSVFA